MSNEVKNEMIEDGVSLGELFSIVWKRKIFISAITIGVMLVFVLFVMLFINPKRSTYSTTFEMEFLDYNNGKYPSGLLFDYRDIISDENVEFVINTNKSFANINVDKFDNDTLAIEKVEYNGNGNAYTITVAANLFKTEDLAVEFVSKLIYLERQRVVDDYNSLSFENYLTASVSSNTFESQLTFLKEQTIFLTNNIQALIDMYGDREIVDQKLTLFQKEFQIYIQTNEIDALITTLSSSSFVKDYDSSILWLKSKELSLAKQISEKQQQINLLVEQRDELLGQANSGFFPEIDSYNVNIIKLTLEKSDLENELLYIKLKIDNGNYDELDDDGKILHDQFVQSISKVYTTLLEYTNRLEVFSQEMFDDFFVTNIPHRDVVELNGSISLLFTLILGGLFGGGISCVVFIGVDLSKSNKEKKEEITK